MKQYPKIPKTIIIHGPGRSGTTLLHNMMCMHPSLGWISSWVNKYPKHGFLSVLNKCIELPTIDRFTRNKTKYPRPTEAYHFWQYYLPEFNSQTPQMTGEDQQSTLKRLRSILRWQGKKRLLFKITGNARASILEQLFDDPYVIWINRAPKPVIMSYYKQRWGYKNNPQLFEQKDKKELIKEYVAKYEGFQKERELLKPFRLLEVQYEDLVANPQKVLMEICTFCKLEMPTSFEKSIASWEMRKDTQSSYKKYLNEEEELFLDAQINKF